MSKKKKKSRPLLASTSMTAAAIAPYLVLQSQGMGHPVGVMLSIIFLTVVGLVVLVLRNSFRWAFNLAFAITISSSVTFLESIIEILMVIVAFLILTLIGMLAFEVEFNKADKPQKDFATFCLMMEIITLCFCFLFLFPLVFS